MQSRFEADATRSSWLRGDLVVARLSVPFRRGILAAAVGAFFAGAAPDTAAQTAPVRVLEAPSVDVIGTTPLPGLGTPLDQVPANVQVATDRDIDRSQAVDLQNFLDREIGSVNLNSVQGNPYQADVNFRGFSASPLVGTPQGLSVFQDGVRVNEAFADTVNWDFIPRFAIANVTVIPGSNPVFGLNTLGGSIGVRMKSGRDYPGAVLNVFGGSFGRKAVEAQYGGQTGDVDYYVGATYLGETGWRDFSGSRIRQVFAKIGYETADTDVDLSFTGASNTLNGTQASPLALLAADRKAPYTYPDQNVNQLAFVNLSASHFADRENLVAANAYYRRVVNRNFSSNVFDDFDPSLPVGTCLEVDCDELNYQATNDTSRLTTNGWGASAQYTYSGRVFGLGNQLTLGVSYDRGDTSYSQDFQYAQFTDDRGTAGTTPFVNDTSVKTTNSYYGAYFTDTLAITERLFLTLAGRYNRAKVTIADETGLEPALNGSHTFGRFNPAAGLNINVSSALNAYLSYNEGMRAPTAVELTCADPTAPCKLPNAFVADPPLNPVISRTFEAGVRGVLPFGTQYSVAVFRTDLQDDLQFVSSAAIPTAGYFQNVGDTRRQGLELGLAQSFGRLSLQLRYSLIDATFQSPFTVASPNNSSAVDSDGDGVPDLIYVEPGNRIPGIPQNQFKFRAGYAFTPEIRAGLNVIAFSSQYARGDENNQDVNGKVPGYAVVNLDASWHVAPQFEVFGQVSNLFNRKYSNFGTLGRDYFTGSGFSYYDTTPGAAPMSTQFQGPGAPFGAWVGLRFTWGGKKV
jgi:outer membrane receptor protein involved in Fe transport